MDKMMLQELYQEVIVDHGKRPRNFKKLADYTHTLEGYNPLCGDRLTLYLNVANDVITDVGFEGSGCAISMASTSLMTEYLKGKTLIEAEHGFAHFQKMVTQECTAPAEELGKLRLLAGVREFPMRVKCATLPWHTYHGAVYGSKVSAKTE